MKIKKYISINRKLLLIYLKNPKLPGAETGAKVCLDRILQAQNALKHTGFDKVDGKAVALELKQFKFKERSIRFLLKTRQRLIRTRQRLINSLLRTMRKIKVAALKLKKSKIAANAVGRYVVFNLSTQNIKPCTFGLTKKFPATDKKNVTTTNL